MDRRLAVKNLRTGLIAGAIAIIVFALAWVAGVDVLVGHQYTSPTIQASPNTISAIAPAIRPVRRFL